MIDRRFSPNGLRTERKYSSRVSVLAVVLVGVLMVGGIAGLLVQIVNIEGPHASATPVRTPSGVLYTMHAPISIVGNAGFLASNATTGISMGNGTASDPFVIEGWDINASAANGIDIENTNAYFILRDCFIYDGSMSNSSNSGIYLLNCTNGTLNSNTCSNDYFGIDLWSSSDNNAIWNNNCSSNGYGIGLYDSSGNNTVSNNTCSLNSGYGIYLYWSGSNNTLSSNTCSNDYYGIALESSNNNTLTNNNCSNSGEGMLLYASSDNNTLSNNNCSNNYNGIDLWLSSRITVTNNSCILNSGYGIVLTSSSNDTLSNNTCNSDGQTGTDLESSSNNTLIDNTCNSNNDCGIYLYSSSFNTLSDNICSSNYNDGIDVISSSNNMLSGNNCTLNDYEGIYLYSSSENALRDNACDSNNDCGVYLDSSSSNNTLSNNDCSMNSYDGVDLVSSSNNTLYGNNCSLNQEDGIYFSGIGLISSSNNTLSWNQLYNSAYYGIEVNFGSTYNRIWNNTFMGNNGAGGSYDPSDVQASDNGASNSWNSTEGYGNYWSDWTTPDANHDGIVDQPYAIDGSAGAQDNYPLTTVQTQIPEFGMMPFVVIALMALVVVAGETRRRKNQ